MVDMVEEVQSNIDCNEFGCAVESMQMLMLAFETRGLGEVLGHYLVKSTKFYKLLDTIAKSGQRELSLFLPRCLVLGGGANVLENAGFLPIVLAVMKSVLVRRSAGELKVKPACVLAFWIEVTVDSLLSVWMGIRVLVSSRVDEVLPGQSPPLLSWPLQLRELRLSPFRAGTSLFTVSGKRYGCPRTQNCRQPGQIPLTKIRWMLKAFCVKLFCFQHSVENLLALLNSLHPWTISYRASCM